MAVQSRPGAPLPPFLLTRPAAQGARFAEALAARFPGALVVASPLLAPRLLAPALPPGPFDAVIFTSETGVAAAAALPGPLPRRAFAVGARTAAAARAAGFAARAAGGDAEALVAMLAALRPGRLLHLHGAETRGEVAARLSAAGVPTAAAVVYRQEPQPLSPAARALLAGGGAVAVPLFSPRPAALFAAAAAGARAALWLASLAPAVDAAAAGLPAARRAVARRPDAEAMLEALAELLAAGGEA